MLIKQPCMISTFLRWINWLRLEIAQTDVLDLYEATCRILAKPQSDVTAFLTLAANGVRALKSAPANRHISFYQFAIERRLKAANQHYQDKLMACEQALVT